MGVEGDKTKKWFFDRRGRRRERERETVFFQVCSLPPIRASGAAPWSGEKNRAKRETRERRRQKESEFQLVDLLFSYFSYSFVRFLFLK